MVWEGRQRIGVNKEDDMGNEIKILQFLSDNNDRCTGVEFRQFDTDSIQLAPYLIKLTQSGMVDHENEGTEDEEIKLTKNGKRHLEEET